MYKERELEMDIINKEAHEEAAQDYLRIKMDEDYKEGIIGGL